MASVWYVGPNSERRIFAQDWAMQGITGPDVIWNESNGYSIRESTFNTAQLNVLKKDISFLFGQADTPRPGSSVVMDPYRKVTWTEFQQALAGLTPGGGTGPSAPVDEDRVLTQATEASIRSTALALKDVGGTVIVPAGTIQLTSPLPIYQGVKYQFVVPVMRPVQEATPQYLGDMEWNFIGGTVLQGNGTFPAFAANDTDLANPASPIGATQISNVGIVDVGLDNFTSAIRIGAKNTMGVVWSEFRNIYIKRCSEWGVRFVNFQHCVFDNIKTSECQNGQYYGVDMPMSILMPGNSRMDELFNLIPRDGRNQRLCRGIVFDAGTRDGVLNELQVGRIQANQFRDTPLAGDLTLTAGSADIPIDPSQFAVNMPLVITGGRGGFETNKTYLVHSINGNTMRLKDHVTAGPRTAGESGALGVATYGFPNVEITRQSGTASVRHSTFDGLDLEGGSTASLYIDGASSIKVHVNEIPFFHHNDLVMRQSSFVQVTTGVAMRTDVDIESSSYQYQGQRDRIVGIEGTGFWLNSLTGAREFSLSGYSGGPELQSRDGGFFYGRFGEHVRPGGFSEGLDPGWMGHAVWNEGSDRRYSIVEAISSRIGSWHSVDNAGTATVEVRTSGNQVFNRVDGLNKIYIPAKTQARFTCVAGDNGEAFWMVTKTPLVVKPALPASMAGQEIAAARRQSQFSWSGQDWVTVEGVEFRASTTDGPAYISANVGLVVFNGTQPVVMEYRILDDTLQAQAAYNTINVGGRAEGFNSAYMPVITGRIPNGYIDHKFILQVKTTGDYGSAYLTPDWLPGATCDLYLIGA